MPNTQKPKNESYLTQLKELPEKETESRVHKVKQAIKVEKQAKLLHNSIKEESKPETTPAPTNKTRVHPDADPVTESVFSKKDILLGVINLSILSLTLYLIFVSLPAKATEHNKLKMELLENSSGVIVLQHELVPHKEKADKLQELFLDESGVVDFVKDVEDIKKEEPVIQKLTIPNQKTLKDKTGLYGIPVVIEMKGKWQEIDQALQKINSLPYLFRAAKFDVSQPRKEILDPGAPPVVLDPDVLEFTYGGFLYVRKELAKDR